MLSHNPCTTTLRASRATLPSMTTTSLPSSRILSSSRAAFSYLDPTRAISPWPTDEDGMAVDAILTTRV